MFRLRKLYTEPQQIDPIVFDDGINIIMGERDETSQKTNGVGKSLCVEFINFALLKSRNSRVTKIPKSTFSPDTWICVDVLIGGKLYAIKRKAGDANRPEIHGPSGIHKFDNLSDATTFLTEKVLANVTTLSRPGFRKLMGPLMRDERSEFKSIISCYDTKDRVPDDYEPHLFFFGIEIGKLNEVKEAIGRYDDLNKEQGKIKQNLSLVRKLTIKDARAELNELDAEVKRIEESIDQLETTTGFEIVKDDIFKLEESMEAQRRERDVMRRQLRKLRPISRTIDIDTEEVVEFYAAIEARLGDIIKRDLTEVIEFKNKIDEFQNSLLQEQRDQLNRDIKEISDRLSGMELQYRKFLRVINQEGRLKNLKQTYAAFKEKSDELAQLRSFVSRFDTLEKDKQKARIDREVKLLDLQTMISNAEVTIKTFEQFVLAMHEFIQGNRKASFAINTTGNKQVVEFEMRIDDDGSHSVEREKVFIYDISLLLSSATRNLHLGYLLHDNIFGVDDDTLKKSLDFLYRKAEFALSQQYIITVNADQIKHVTEGSDFAEDLNEDVVASFTKSNRFLKVQYQEIS